MFKQGMKLRSVSGPLDPNGDGVFFTTDKERKIHEFYAADSIEVVDEPGLGAMTQWALVKRAGKPDTMVNLAMMESVEIEPTED